MTNQNLALNYAYAILGTAFVCTGMIMDAEVLVLYMWILFVALAYSYGSNIVDNSIRTEALKIGKEFDSFFDVQNKIIKTLINYHILQVLVISQVKALLDFSKNEINNLISAKKSLLDSSLATQMEQKLSYLASKEQTIGAKVQADACKIITDKIYSVFTTDNKDKQSLKAKILDENMSRLEKM